MDAESAGDVAGLAATIIGIVMGLAATSLFLQWQNANNDRETHKTKLHGWLDDLNSELKFQGKTNPSLEKLLNDWDKNKNGEASIINCVKELFSPGKPVDLATDIRQETERLVESCRLSETLNREIRSVLRMVWAFAVLVGVYVISNSTSKLEWLQHLGFAVGVASSYLVVCSIYRCARDLYPD